MNTKKEYIDFMVDVETDGPIPNKFSMISFGAIIVEPSLDRTFYGLIKPISEIWDPEALAISGHSREECLTFPSPEITMGLFYNWIINQSEGKIPRFWSDNNGFDWSFINYYFHMFCDESPFGWTSINLNSTYKGMKKNLRESFKHLVITKHSHHPVEDAKGCAEALLSMKAMGLKV